MSRPLVVIAAVEVALVVACFMAVIGHAVWLRLTSDRLRSQLTTANGLLHQYLEFGQLSREDMRQLRRLRTSQQIGLFASFSGAFHGLGRNRMSELARELGLLDLAARNCASRRWSRRLQGVRLFTLVGGDNEKPLMLFDDSQEEVRAAVAEWGAEHPTPVVIQRLVSMLEDPSVLCRFTVKDSLVRLGPAITPALVEHLVTTDVPSEEILEVATSLADPRFLEAARNLRNHPSPALRVRVLQLLAALGGSDAMAMLVEAVRDPDADVRATALRAFGKLESWQSASLIVEGLADREWIVRKEAGIALGALGAPGALLLRQALSSSDRFTADMARHILDIRSLDDQRGHASP